MHFPYKWYHLRKNKQDFQLYNIYSQEAFCYNKKKLTKDKFPYYLCQVYFDLPQYV